MRKRKVKHLLSAYYEKMQPKWAKMFTFSEIDAHIIRLQKKYNKILMKEFISCTNGNPQKPEILWKSFWGLFKHTCHQKWMHIWREKHPGTYAALQTCAEKYPFDIDLNALSYLDWMDYKAVLPYLREIQLQPPKEDLWLRLTTCDPKLHHAIAAQDPYAIQDILDQYWSCVSDVLIHQWCCTYKVKNEHQANHLKSEQKRMEMSHKRIRDYQQIRSRFCSRDALKSRWFTEHHMNLEYSMHASGNTNFTDEIKAQFNREFISREFIIISSCHNSIVSPSNTIMAFQRANVQNFPATYQILSGSTDPVAIFYQNIIFNRMLRHRLADMSSQIKHRVVLGYWQGTLDGCKTFGFVPAYIIYNTNSSHPVDLMELGKVVMNDYNQERFYYHPAETCDSAVLNGSLICKPPIVLPIQSQDIVDLLDLFFRFQFATAQPESSIACIRYVNGTGNTEEDITLRLKRGEDLWT